VAHAAARALDQARASVEAMSWLRTTEPAVAAFAPARLDVLGGIADYSGATVLELPLARGVVAIAQCTSDGSLSVATTGPAAPAESPVALPLDILFGGARSEAPERLRAGDAMYRSHASYSARCGLGTPETDLLVELARGAGPEQGVYGARITGGVAGGTDAMLVAGAAGEAAVHRVAAEYARRRAAGLCARTRRAAVLGGSADGAMRIPAVSYTPGRSLP
jgi:galactokinase